MPQALSEDPSVDAMHPLGTNTVIYEPDKSAYAEILKQAILSYRQLTLNFDNIKADFIANVDKARLELEMSIKRSA